MRDPRPQAILLIGFPGAGKTTWRRRWLAERTATRPAAIASTDDLILAEAQAAGIPYAEAWKRAGKLDGRARNLVRAAVAAGADVVVDRTNLKAATRARFLRLFPPEYARSAVVFAVPPEVLRSRLEARAEAGGHGVPWPFVVGMMRSYEAPAPGEFERVTFVGPDGREL